jgi:hypothetical protein
MMAVTVTMGFVLAHNLALGHDLSQLRSVSVTILTLYRMLLGEDAYDEVKNLEYRPSVLALPDAVHALAPVCARAHAF